MYTLCKIGKLEYKLKCSYCCIVAWQELTGEKQISKIFEKIQERIESLDILPILKPLIYQPPTVDNWEDGLWLDIELLDLSEITLIVQKILEEIARSNTMPTAKKSREAKQELVEKEATP